MNHRPRLLARWIVAVCTLAVACSDGQAVSSPDAVDAGVDWSSAEIVVTGSCTVDSDCLAVSDCVLSSSCVQGHCVYLFATPGSECAEGCYSQGKCQEEGVCSGTQIRECPEADGNNCTQPVCDLKSGECVEEAIEDGETPYATSECWTGLTCLHGEPDTSQAEPTAMALECEELAAELDPMGCVEGYVCVGGAEKCRPLYKDDGIMCWMTAGSETDAICRGASCSNGECVLDPSLDTECTAEDLPDSCGADCQACTSLTCHWIDDPADPENPTKKVRYCRPAATLGVACTSNPCRESQACIVGSQSNGPLGKETLGSCSGGTELDAQACAAGLSKNPLPCVLAGIGCSPEKGGCTYDGALANQWCWPPEGQCYNKETTFCSHVSSGPGWDPATGCDVDWVELDCNDQNDCTVDSCKAVNNGWTCLHQPLDGIACDDGDPCTTEGMCVVGVCTGQVPRCQDSDQNPCNDQKCDPATGQCLAPETNGLSCDDQDACTQDDTCQDSACQPGTLVNCDDADACNGIESCDVTAGCLPGIPLECDDGSVCNGQETCDPLAGCLPGTALVCDDNDLCNGEETCDPTSGCQPGSPLACVDTNLCNGTETCDSELGCLPGSALSCVDQNLCNGTETCAPLEGCKQGTALECDDANLCNGIETCNPLTGCKAGTALVCDDNDLCNGEETCDSKLGCLPGSPLACKDTNLCNGTETCDALLGCLPGTPLSCNDQNLCNGTETCAPLEGCKAGTPLVCDNANVCDGVEGCNPATGCTSGTPLVCGDSNVCNGIETCSPTAGCQAGSPLNCLDNNLCNGTESCDPELGCLPGTNLECQDDTVCNGTETCSPTLGCQPGTALNCNDGFYCTSDICDPALGCLHPLLPDGTSCTGGSAFKCVAGLCKCVPQCTGVECGDDQCGGSCGTCTSPEECMLGICQGSTITPEGNFTITPTVIYSCLSGGININITEVLITKSGTTYYVTLLPSMCSTLVGTWNSSTNVLTAGGVTCTTDLCDHSYMFVATFSDNNHFTLFYRFTPLDVLGSCGDCKVQIKNGLVGVRK